jgi:hypothetical protein
MPPRLLLPLLCCCALAACAPTTPLFLAQVGTQGVAESKEMKSNRMLAAIEDEGDLLTYSAMAIRDGTSATAETTYMQGYQDERLSDEVRAMSLYQIGLVYMSRFNDQRDDIKALNTFYKVRNEFAQTRAAARSEQRIELINQRANEPLQQTARELLANWKPSQTLDLDKASLDPDMTLLSRRAVLKDRVPQAEELYGVALKDPAVEPSIKEEALYQVALMYLAADNPHPSRDKAIEYLRQLLAQYPNSELREKAARHLDTALNTITP